MLGQKPILIFFEQQQSTFCCRSSDDFFHSNVHVRFIIGCEAKNIAASSTITSDPIREPMDPALSSPTDLNAATDVHTSMQAIQDENTRLQREVHLLTTQLTTKTNTFAALQTTIARLKTHGSKLKGEIKAIQSEAESKDQIITDYVATGDSLRTKMVSLETQLVILQDENRALRETSVDSHHPTVALFKSKIDTLQLLVDTLTSENTSLTKGLQSEETTNIRRLSENKLLDAEARASATSNAVLKAEIAILKADATSKDSLVVSLQADNTAKTNQIRTLLAHIESLEVILAFH